MSKIQKLRKPILEKLREFGVLNIREICRLLNLKGKEEYSWCYYTFKEKPKGTAGPGKKPCRHFDVCNATFPEVQAALKRMKIRSRKMRFYDKGGIGTDLFRFYFLDPKQLQEKVLRFTMLGHLGKPAHPQRDLKDFLLGEGERGKRK